MAYIRLKLVDKHIVVTGGTKGLGRALVERFAQEGAYVASCARSADDVRRSTLELVMFGPRVLFSSCDIADSDQVGRFAQEVISEFGTIDVLVNNASQLGPRLELASWTKPTWDRIIDVNVNGLFGVTMAFLPTMIVRRSGSIINVSSSVGRKGQRLWGAYGVSKFALEGFTQTLADEVVHQGIRVNSVNPGPLDTDMRHAAYPDEDRSKLRKPSEVTDVFVFLASDESRAISGQSFDAQEYIKTKKEKP